MSFENINWTDFALSSVVSFALGYVVSIWASSNYEKKKAKRERDKLNTIYKNLSGFFENYNQRGTKISDASFQYTGENSFNITVTTYLDGNGNLLAQESIQQWVGEVWMDGARHGHLIYHFKKPENNPDMHHKRIMISPDKSRITVFGEAGHGTESFKRK